MSLLLVILLLGPAEALSGKYPRPVAEFPSRVPELPDPLPDGVGSLCELIEMGRAEPEIYAALGEALLRKGDTALAYRAFRKAQVLGEDPAWRRRMQARRDASTFVPDAVIEAEEKEAALWRERLETYQRDRVARGEDPHDLAPFYARYGAPGERMDAAMRGRRATALLTVAGVLIAVAAGVGLLVWKRRRAA